MIVATLAAVGTALAINLPASVAAGVTVTVTPNSGLNDGDTVEVQASGLPANHASVQVVECVRGATDSSQCDGNTLDVSGDSDSSGNYDNPSYTVSTLSTANHDSIDCDANHGCEIFVGTDYNNAFSTNSGAANICFGADTSCPSQATTTTTTGSTTTTTTGSGSTTTTTGSGSTTTTTGSGSTTTTTGSSTTSTTSGATLTSPDGTTVVAGFQMNLAGAGLPKDQSGSIVLNSTPVTLQTIQTDASGGFSTVVRIPADTLPGAHTLVVTVNGVSASLAITVLAPSGTTSPTTPAATPVVAAPNFTG